MASGAPMAVIDVERARGRRVRHRRASDRQGLISHPDCGRSLPVARDGSTAGRERKVRVQACGGRGKKIRDQDRANILGRLRQATGRMGSGEGGELFDCMHDNENTVSF